MYVGFEIDQYQPSSPVSKVDTYILDARQRVDNLARFIVGSYNQRSVLDADALSAAIFPESNYDVFLSHSHADQRNAIDLALALGKHGVKVFVDSNVWGYFGDLVGKIIASTQPLSGETRDAHIHRIHADVHMMLIGALHRTIARSETFVFVRSEKSVPLSFGDKARTFSPWLYSELQFSFQVRHTVPSRIQKKLSGVLLDSTRGFESYSTESMQHLTAFRVFNEHLPQISGGQLREWLVQQSPSVQGEAMLDALYSRFGIPDQYKRKRDSLKF